MAVSVTEYRSHLLMGAALLGLGEVVASESHFMQVNIHHLADL
jgi:hypothetical protein